MDKTRVAIYKRGEEPSDVSYWRTRPAWERLMALETIRREYNQWKYGTGSEFQRVYRVIKRERLQDLLDVQKLEKKKDK